MSIIKLENVDFYYNFGKANQFQALKNINLEVEEGEFVAVFGPSGCGKTTLLYVIAGIEKPQQGKVFVLGEDITQASKEELALYRQIGISFIFQTFNLIPSLRAIDNVTLPMAFVGISSQVREKRAMELLERLGIAELKDRYPNELSGGQQQRVAIARALANDPPIILADEPIGNLDTVNAKNVLDLLVEINRKEKKTIIMVTHQPWTLKGTVKKIFFMKDGEIIKVLEITKQTLKEIEKLGAVYYTSLVLPEFPREKIYISSLANLILRGYPREEIERFEEILWQRLTNKIDKDKFKEFLDRPYSEGGVGLWRQKAEKITNYVEKLIELKVDLEEIIKEAEEHPAEPLFEEIKNIQDWLLEEHKFYLTPFQQMRFQEAIYQRIRKRISHKDFIEILDLPPEEGGVGLRTNTALKIGEKLEILLGK